MIIISHRGNISGPNKEKENNPEYVEEALKYFNVEVDVWYVNKKWFLGHDGPSYLVDLSFLKQSGIWCHSKNIEGLYQLMEHPDKINCFWHQEDDVTLTSFGYLWTYPGKKLTNKSIAVLPEKGKFKNLKFAAGMCTDFTFLYEGEYLK